MLNVLIPIHQKNLDIAPVCIDAIDKQAPGVPYSIVLAVDGATKEDFGELRAVMNSRKRRIPRDPIEGEKGAIAQFMDFQPPPEQPGWSLVEWPGTVYYQKTIEAGLFKCAGEFILIVPPWVEFKDRNWFGKLQQPYMVDPHAMLVSVPAPEVPQNTMRPARYMRRKHPGTEVILTRRTVARDVVTRMSPVDGARAWVDEFSRVAELMGGTRWLAGSVRYFTIEHHDHVCPQPERSAPPAPKSESPSPTTESSSTPTTTEPDGIGVSAPF